MKHTLKITPLGGLGRFGGNLLVYEAGQELLVVDAGMVFPTDDEPGIDYLVPDISYILFSKLKLTAFMITHGHEDHIGALPYIWPHIPAPIYGTAFTLALLKAKFSEFPQLKPEFRLLTNKEAVDLGIFTVTPFNITHSIPGAVLLGIKTPLGKVVHTGDFKLDAQPLDQVYPELDALKEYLGGDNPESLMLLADSTNAHKTGHTKGEVDIASNIENLITTSKGTVFLTTFASNIYRLQIVMQAAAKAGRKVIALGRSMVQNLQIASSMGLIPNLQEVLVDASQFAKLSRQDIVVLATGCQGEMRSAMSGLANGQRYLGINILPGERVILSARRIPGSERQINKMINNFCRLGVEVIDGSHSLPSVHVSGHAFNDEQRELLTLCAPKFFMPIHGELYQLQKHAELAAEAGLPKENIIVVEDGTQVVLSQDPETATVSCRVGGQVKSGLICIAGSYREEITPDPELRITEDKTQEDLENGLLPKMVLKERRTLARNGFIGCLICIDLKANNVLEPVLINMGVFADKSLEVKAKKVAKHAVQELLGALTAKSSGKAADLRSKHADRRGASGKVFKALSWLKVLQAKRLAPEEWRLQIIEQVQLSLRKFFKQELLAKPVIKVLCVFN